MRFTTAWADIVSQNITLKVTIGILSLSLVATVVALVKVSLRDPLIVERSCYSRVATRGSTEHSEPEIKAFVEEALRERFNSEVAVVPGFLSAEEEGFKKQEQQNLKSSQMTQKIIVNRVQVEKNQVTVDSDRIISVGDVRSAFIFPLTIFLSGVPRSEINPYGLQLTKVTPVKKDAPRK